MEGRLNVLLGVCLLLGLAIAGLLGVDLWRALDLRLRHTWAIWGALGVQLVIFGPLAGRLPHATIVPLHVGSYALIGIFLALNLRVAGMPLIAVGWLANTTAIAANRGRMPISLRDWELSGRAANALTKTGVENNNVLARHAQLGWLGDIFPLPPRVPLANAFSIGDVLIVAGAVAVVSLAGTRRTASRAALAPLRERAFLRLTAARGLSQLGDWITLAAAVTWLYARTGTTWPVSCYLIARIAASLLGGLVGHRLIGRPGRERFATLFALRGALTAGAFLAAAVGPALVAVALLVLSAAIAPVTNATTAALTPHTVPDAILHRANALSGLVLELAVVAGAAIGGLAETRFGLSLPLGIDIGTFAIAAIVLAGARVRPHTDGNASDPVRFTDLAGRLLRHDAARPLLLSFAVATAGVGMVNASLPRFLSHLHTNGGYGIAIACIGGGAMIGGILVGSLNESRAIHRSVTLGFAGMAVAVAVLAEVAAPATACLILIFVGLLDATTEVSYSTILQKAFAGDHLAAAMTAATVFVSAGMAAGFAVAALANAHLTPLAALLLPAGTCAVAALLALPLARHRRPTNDEASSLATVLARGVLNLPALAHTPLGPPIAVVAECQGRWLAYPADALTGNPNPRLHLPGYEIAVQPVEPAPHNGMWITITDVSRKRQAA